MISHLNSVARPLLVLCVFGTLVRAQAPSEPVEPAAATNTSTPVDSGIHADPAPQTPTTQPAAPPQDKHIFGVLPNYRTAESNGVYTPISVKKKFIIAKSDALDGPGFAIAGALAAIYQLQDQNPSFGQGIKGYTLRYVTAYGDQAIGNMLTEGIMPSLLHEDPRYFRRGTGSVVVRTLHALGGVLITRTDSGSKRFNFSEFIGNGIDASIGNAYYPDGRSLEDTMSRAATDIATDAVSNVLKEFWPDFKKHVLHKGSSTD
jgi:hypothetical protein